MHTRAAGAPVAADSTPGAILIGGAALLQLALWGVYMLQKVLDGASSTLVVQLAATGAAVSLVEMLHTVLSAPASTHAALPAGALSPTGAPSKEAIVLDGLVALPVLAGSGVEAWSQLLQAGRLQQLEAALRRRLPPALVCELEPQLHQLSRLWEAQQWQQPPQEDYRRRQCELHSR